MMASCLWTPARGTGGICRYRFEVVIEGTPLSQRNRHHLRAWRQEVQSVAGQAWDAEPPFAGEVMVVMTYYFKDESKGESLDVDNIPKPILDALSGLVYADDSQITDLVCRKRDRNRDLQFENPSSVLLETLGRSDQFPPRHRGQCAEPGGAILVIATDPEYLLTRKTADEYRSKGYEVLFEGSTRLHAGLQGRSACPQGRRGEGDRGEVAAVTGCRSQDKQAGSAHRFEARMELRAGPGERAGKAGFTRRRACIWEWQDTSKDRGSGEVPSGRLAGGRLPARMVGLRSRHQGAAVSAGGIEGEHHFARVRPQPGGIPRRHIEGRARQAEPHAEIQECPRPRIRRGRFQ